MPLNTLAYVAFLPLVILLNYLCPKSFRKSFLLIASWIFYAFLGVELFFLLLVLTSITFIAAKEITNDESRYRSLLFLILAFLSGGIVLFILKFLDPLLSFYNRLFTGNFVEEGKQYIHMLVPLGLTFYLLHLWSYLMDVYKGEIRPEKDFISFSLYVSYFPKLLAGPIEKFADFNKQLNNLGTFNIFYFSKGFLLICFGLFSKLLVADRIDRVVDEIYAHTSELHSSYLLLAIFLYAIQVFADLYAYILLARGSSLMLGVNLTKNTNSPYKASSISAFLYRWHSSLYDWFKNYLITPVLSVIKKKYLQGFALIFLMVIVAIWHKANLNFAILGFCLGILLLFERLNYLKNDSSNVIIINFKRFLVISSIAVLLVFFRSATLNESFSILSSLLNNWSTNFAYLPIDLLGLWPILVFILFEVILNLKLLEELNIEKYSYMHIILSFLFLILVIFFADGNNQAFIYFQF